MNSMFQGRYVEDVRDLIVGALLANEHALLIGPPGCGKTAIARDVVNRVTDGLFVFTRLDASTPPEKVVGMEDPAELLASPPRLVKVVKGTPYDPDARSVILDEIGRPSDVIFDILIDTLERQDVRKDDAPTIIATTNFMNSTERTAALHDRISMWMHVKSGAVDVNSTVRAILNGVNTGLSTPGSLPSWADVEAARSAVPGSKAVSAVARVIDALAGEAEQANYSVNYRTYTQWSRLLFRVSHYYSGSDDFDSVHPKATDLLKYAWPAFTNSDSLKWAEVCNAVADPVQSAIDALRTSAFDEFKKAQNTTQGARSAKAIRFGEILRDAEESMRELGDDERIEEAISELTNVFAQLVRGEDPFK
jgi:hypothetical protein